LDIEAKVARGAASLYLASIVTLLLNTAYFVVLTNLLGSLTAEVGVVTLLNILITLTATVSNLALPLGGTGVTGTPPAVSRFVSEYSGGGNGGRAAWRILVYSLAIALVSSIVSSFLLFSSPRLFGIRDSQGQSALFFAGVDAVVFSLGQLGAYALIGVGKPVTAAYALLASNMVRYSAASVLLSILGLFGIFLGFAIGDGVLLVIGLPISFRAISRLGRSKIDGKLVLTYMLSVLASSLIGFGIGQIDKLIALFQAGAASFVQLAIYNVGIAGAAIATFAPNAVTNVLVPSLSSIPLTETDTRRKLIQDYTRYVTFVASPMGFMTAATSPFLLRLFGDQYVVASPVVAVVALSVAFSAVGSVYASSILAGQKAHLFLTGNVAALLTLLILAIALFPLLGLTGVAIGRAGMLVASAIVFGYIARSNGSFVLDKGAYVKATIASALSSGMVYMVLFLLSGAIQLTRAASVFSGLIVVIPGIMVYLVLLKLMKAFSRQDIAFLERVLPKALSWVTRLAEKFL
jgi:O-antigen/teichoic acid export membrane protein